MSKIKRRAFWPDTHTPWHDTRAVQITLDILSQYGSKAYPIDEFIFMGDFFDCYLPSSFRKDPYKVSAFLEDELARGRDLIGQIGKVVRARKFIFLEGNHEARLRNWLYEHGPFLVPHLQEQSVFGIPSAWHYIKYGQRGYWNCDGLVAFHGVRCQRHAAFSTLQKYQTSVIFAHTHRTQSFTVRNFRGDTLSAYNIGWLGDNEKAADYVKDCPDATQSFAVGEFDGRTHNIQIITLQSGKAVFGGKTYAKRSTP